MGYKGRYRFCRSANWDAGILGYTGEDVRAHCREWALDGKGPPHINAIPMIGGGNPPPTLGGIRVSERKSQLQNYRANKNSNGGDDGNGDDGNGGNGDDAPKTDYSMWLILGIIAIAVFGYYNGWFK